jgi:hypothetical protein
MEELEKALATNASDDEQGVTEKLAEANKIIDLAYQQLKGLARMFHKPPSRSQSLALSDYFLA